MLFADSPALGSVTFVSAYLLGIGAALGSAFVLKKSILKGESAPMVLELPPFRMPSLRNSLLTVYDRGGVFVRKVGTVIVFISVILWAMSTYPKLSEQELPGTVAMQVADLRKNLKNALQAFAQPVQSRAGRVADAHTAYFKRSFSARRL